MHSKIWYTASRLTTLHEIITHSIYHFLHKIYVRMQVEFQLLWIYFFEMTKKIDYLYKCKNVGKGERISWNASTIWVNVIIQMILNSYNLCPEISLYINWKSEMMKWNIRRSPPNLHILYALGSSSLYSVSFGIMPINLYTQSCYHPSLHLLELQCTCVFFIICAVDTIENPFIHTLQSTINKYCFLPSFIP